MGIKDLFKSVRSEENPDGNLEGFLFDGPEDEDPSAVFIEEEPLVVSGEEFEEISGNSDPQQSSVKRDNKTKESVYAGPVGLDVGTANIVTAHGGGTEVKTLTQLNAFYDIPFSSITKQTLLRDDIPFFQKNEKLYILGYHAEDFAGMLGGETRRPIESGILNPREEEAISVIKAIINGLVKKPRKWGEKICFSVPGKPFDGLTSVVYHESIIRMHLQSIGYSPIPINEGLAVILAELAGNNYTGIGISMGGGMCNVCLAYLSVPVITYSIQKGGDYIDSMVAKSVGETPTIVRQIKENELDLSVEPRTRIETGLHIFYDDLFGTLLESLRQILGSSDRLPRLSKPIPLVLSGGTVLPRGVRGRFIDALKEIRLPVKISDILITEKPLYATAKGALIMARTEEASV